ncbi:protein of unknown function (plasmid) [Caballeronia sp. S22]
MHSSAGAETALEAIAIGAEWRLALFRQSRWALKRIGPAGAPNDGRVCDFSGKPCAIRPGQRRSNPRSFPVDVAKRAIALRFPGYGRCACTGHHLSRRMR